MLRPEELEMLLKVVCSGNVPNKMNIHDELAQESKKLYDAHIKMGFDEKQALALTCAILQ